MSGKNGVVVAATAGAAEEHPPPDRVSLGLAGLALSLDPNRAIG